jgi:predicted ATPase with chaperone activity
MHVLAIASGCLSFRALLYLNSELVSELRTQIKKAFSNSNFQMADRSRE